MLTEWVVSEVSVEDVNRLPSSRARPHECVCGVYFYYYDRALSCAVLYAYIVGEGIGRRPCG